MKEAALDKRAILTVVVPTYNGEDYLAECLDSILSQTLTDYEVICVDDGSTDATPSILARYKESDGRIDVVRQENAGVSAARNRGLSMACGKYILFLDDDDLFEPDMFELMVCKMEEDQAETCLCGGWRYDVARKTKVRGKAYLDASKLPANLPFTAEEAGKYLFQITTFHMYKMHSVDALRRGGIEFRPYRVSEDAIFNTEALLNSRGITAVDKPLFTYRVNSGTSVSATVSKDILAGYRSMLEIQSILKERRLYHGGIKQSFVNKALSSTIHYRRQATTLASFEEWYSAMVVDRGLEKLDLLGHDEDFFYRPGEYRQLNEMLQSEGVNDYLFSCYLDACRARDDARAASRQKKAELKALKKSRSYRIAQRLTRLARTIRQ